MEQNVGALGGTDRGDHQLYTPIEAIAQLEAYIHSKYPDTNG